MTAQRRDLLIVIGGMLFLAVALQAWNARPPAGPDPARFDRAYEDVKRAPRDAGSQDVYLRISGMTSCPELQATFDRNMDDAERRKPSDPLREITLSYARAADTRMKALGCY